MPTIRDAQPDDLATMVDFNCRLAEESEHKTLDRSTVERGVRRALERPELCRYFIAEEAGRPVGQTMITYEWTDWRDGVCWWIQSVYVRPDARRSGVFRALFQHIEQLARSSPDCRGLRLYVEQHNAPALATYKNLGMQPSGHVLYEIDWTL
jgi:GNAT superfamily N-acetyltransferase